MRARSRVAFVVQRCAPDVYGGAERLCLQVAQHLLPYWQVEILTTCARDSRTWANEYPAGAGSIEGVPCLRFPVDQERDMAAFDRLSEALEPRVRQTTPREQHDWRTAQGPLVPGLRKHLLDAGDQYALVYFFSYLYATTYDAVDALADRSVLVPLAHDEWMLRFPFWNEVVRMPWRVVFSSEEERLLLERRFGTMSNAGPTIGAGIDPPDDLQPQRFRDAFGISEPFALSIGRVEAAKGSDTLIDDFIALRKTEDQPRKLVLAGPIGMAIPEHPDIIALGPLEERDKWDALAAADLTIVASAFESLSLAALESLSVGTPILVNGASGVLIGHCRRSNAGLWYANREEFIELMRTGLLGRIVDLGENGRAYVQRWYSWEAVVKAHRELGAQRMDGIALDA